MGISIIQLIAAIALVTASMTAPNPVFDVQPAKAQVAGEYTKCIAWSNGTRWNIVRGGYSTQACHNLAIACTNNPNVTIRYYSRPVVINAPYNRCTRSRP